MQLGFSLCSWCVLVHMPGPNAWLCCYWVCNNFVGPHFGELGISCIPSTAGWHMMARSPTKARVVGCITGLPALKKPLWLYLSTPLSSYRYSWCTYTEREIKCLFSCYFICWANTVPMGFLYVMWRSQSKMKMYLCRWLLTRLLSEWGWQENVGWCDAVCITCKVLEGWPQVLKDVIKQVPFNLIHSRQKEALEGKGTDEGIKVWEQE